jgi:hypothetical protein
MRHLPFGQSPSPAGRALDLLRLWPLTLLAEYIRLPLYCNGRSTLLKITLPEAKAQCFTFSEKPYPDDTYSALSSDFPAAKAFRSQLDR